MTQSQMMFFGYNTRGNWRLLTPRFGRLLLVGFFVRRRAQRRLRNLPR